MLPLGHKQEQVYQQAIILTKEIYRITMLFPDTERAVLVYGLRRTAVLLCQHIALSSFKRNGKRRRIYKAAAAACIDLDTQLELAIAVQLLTGEEAGDTFNYLESIYKHLTALIESV